MKHLVILLIPCAAFAEDDFRHGLNSEVLRLTWSENILAPPLSSSAPRAPDEVKPKRDNKPAVPATGEPKKVDTPPTDSLPPHPDFPPEPKVTPDEKKPMLPPVDGPAPVPCAPVARPRRDKRH